MHHPSDGPLAFFTADHRLCDERWGELEAAVEAGDATKAQALWKDFDFRLRRHLSMEEEVLFPAFEDATGMRSGPTVVMRAEHTQMRAVLDRMGREATAGDLDALLDHGDTLLMLIQQHNVKEEGILYPMAQQHLSGQWAEIAAQLERYVAGD